jgi:hypothetical protein
MAVEVRACKACGRRERLILLRITDMLFPPTHFGRACLGAANMRWVAAGSCDGLRWTCLESAIPEGRLFRLSDESLSETDSTERAPRERELTNAKG